MKLILALFFSTIVFAATATEKPEWNTDFEHAKREAGRLERPILVDFTGSDWCGWCIRLKNEVFSQDEFQSFAGENLVLFEADIPRNKPQSDEIRTQNRALQRQYRVRVFPTILLLDATGRELARTGYRPGGPDAYIAHIRELLKESASTETATP